MRTKEYLRRFARNIVERSGLSLQTVEVLLPHVFDEIRYQLTEGTLCVPIESFGTFAVVDIPERQRHYVYNGIDEIRTLAPCKRLKFAPTRSFRSEVEKQKFDTDHHSFYRNHDDPPIRLRCRLQYNGKQDKVHLRPLKPRKTAAEPSE